MEIRNEIKQKEDKKEFVQRSLADIQRAKLNKLMANPDKPVIIPESTKRDKEYVAPSFIRNVMGSSAGAGSGEFHVYRHLRRKEFARQKNMKAQSEREIMDQQFQQKLQDNQRLAEEKTAKKREKRLKKKKKAIMKKGSLKKAKIDAPLESNESQSEPDDQSGDEVKSVSGNEEDKDSTENATVEAHIEEHKEESAENANADKPTDSNEPAEGSNE